MKVMLKQSVARTNPETNRTYDSSDRLCRRKKPKE